MTAKHRIIQVGSYAGSPTANDRMAREYDVIELWKFPDRKAALTEHGKGISVLATSANYGVTAEMMDVMPDLKAICSWGVGYETLDIEAAHKRGIQVSNTPDVLNDCVADLAWGLMLSAARRIPAGDRFVRSGQWGQVHGSIPLGTRVSGKKLGIVGLGRIGQAIAKRGAGFDMDVRYHSRRQRDDVPYTYEASLTGLAEWADFLVVATVGGPSTFHLISREVLEALGPQGMLVNISRGPVIDEQALVEVLASGKLGGAALDVYEQEPIVPDALKADDNLVLLPHVGSATKETRREMENLLFSNIASFLHTGKVITAV